MSYSIILNTLDSEGYVYQPLPWRTLRFKVKAAHDAHVILSEVSEPSQDDHVVEIFIGGWANNESAIRYMKTKPDKVHVKTPDILSENEYRGFWITLHNGVFTVGKENEVEPFMTWEDSSPPKVNYFGIRTTQGASGVWQLEGHQINADASLEYIVEPIPRCSLDVHVEAAHDAHIALTSGPNNTRPMYEIFLGTANNTASAIRFNQEEPDKVLIKTDGLLKTAEKNHFRISYKYGLVQVTMADQVLMEWRSDEDEPLAVSHFGVRTTQGATGQWEIGFVNDSPDVVAWLPSEGGVIPDGAVAGGLDLETLYVGRAQHEGDLVPGKVMKSRGVCYVAWGGKEHAKTEYEVLTGPKLLWVASQDGVVPANAVVGGSTKEGETLYIGLADHDSTRTIGKIQPSHKVCYIPYDGKEIGYTTYDVLVQQ